MIERFKSFKALEKLSNAPFLSSIHLHRSALPIVSHLHFCSQTVCMLSLKNRFHCFALVKQRRKKASKAKVLRQTESKLTMLEMAKASDETVHRGRERCLIFRYRKLLSIVFWALIVDSFSLELFLPLFFAFLAFLTTNFFRDHFQHLFA